MIGPSRRRSDPQAKAAGLDLHIRLARSRDTNRKLRLAALLALAVAVLTWMLGLDLAVRSAAVLGVSALSWLIPLGRSDRWALAWIGERGGLAYQTALELQQREDPYGFAQALEERARDSTIRLEKPSLPAWWLPVLALALGALLLPALPLGSPPGAATGGPGSPGIGDQAPFAGANEPDQQADPETPEEERTRVGSPTDADQTGRGNDGDATREGEAGEQAALDRFLDNLRERPESTAQEQESDRGAGTGERPAGDPRDGGSEGREGDPNRSSDQQRAGEGEANEEGEEQGGTGEEGTGEGEEEQNPFSQAGTAEEEQQATGEEQTPGEGAEAGAESTPGEDGSEAGGDQLDPGGDEAGLGEGAGGQGSEQQEAGITSAAEGEPLFLEGELRSGQVAPGGTVQLPGADDGEFPTPRSEQSYQQEVERAVTEGRIPLEYQEIIRNYFR